MAKTEGILYFKMVVSYGKPTEYDDVGCDGMYVKSIEQANAEVAELRQHMEWLTNRLINVYGENENVDWAHKTRRLLDD